MEGPMRPLIHFVSLGVNPAERNVVGAVSLFSFMAHRVMLAEAFTGPLPEPSATSLQRQNERGVRAGRHETLKVSERCSREGFATKA